MFPFTIYRIKDLVLRVGHRWDKLAPDEKNAIAFAHEHINPEPNRNNKPCPEYALAHGGELNNYLLRKGERREDLYNLAQYVSSKTADTDLVLYRSIEKDTFTHMTESVKDSTVCDLHDEAFLATSLLKSGTFNDSYAKLRLYAPKGTPLVYVGDVNDEQEHFEVVVMCGANLIVESIDKDYINCRIIGFSHQNSDFFLSLQHKRNT